MKKTIQTISLILLISLCLSIYGLWHNELFTLLSIETKIEQNLAHKDGYTYEMNVSGDYYFDEFLAQGGAKNDQELIQFVTDHITKGIIPLKIKPRDIGCSSFTAWTENNEFVFGRNYDFDQTNTAIIHTNPKGRHASISTIDLQFLGISREKGITSLKDKALLLAAPYVPLDGINEAGVACGIYMTYQGAATNVNTKAPDITSTTLLRLILDYADNVEEAIALASQYDMHDSAKTSYHYMVADKDGNSAILEWVHGSHKNDDPSKRKLKVTRNKKPYQVVTNFIVQEDYYPSTKEAKGYDRYEFLTNHLEPINGRLANEEKAMQLLRGVGRRKWVVPGDKTMGTTVHSAVYNLSDCSMTWVANEHYGNPKYTMSYDLTN